MSQNQSSLKSFFCRDELVNKIETSASNLKKRLQVCQRKIRSVTREQKRMGKSSDLYAVNLTLTYANNNEFAVRHISRFLNCLRSKLKRNGNQLIYVWTLERMESLHYHLMIWLPRDMHLKHTELKRWWPWGSTWIQKCRNVHAWSRYISKSESKKYLPNGARIFSYGGLDEQGKAAVQHAMLPLWLKAIMGPHAKLKRVPKVGWVDLLFGEVYKSPWKWTPKGCRLRETEEA